MTHSLVTGERQTLIDASVGYARYVPTGHLVYVQDGTLLAVPFDPNQQGLTTGPVPLVEDISQGASQGVAGLAQYAYSDDGTLVFIPGSASTASYRLSWVDLQGEEESLDVPPGDYATPQVSPDGTRVAMQVAEGTNADIWVADVARGTVSRITTDPGLDQFPIWTPDGQRVVFTSSRDGARALFSKAADGTGEVELLRTFEGGGALVSEDWSPDGKTLVFALIQPTTSGNIGLLSMEGDDAWEPLIDTAAGEAGAALSPDGQWMAYFSNETGRFEVYVQRFPALGERQQISTNGSLDPTWSPEGRALYYLDTGGGSDPRQMVRVSIDAGPPLSVGSPEVLFAYDHFHPGSGSRIYDIAPDGQRFLLLSGESGQGGTGQLQVNVVLNWFEDLKERVPIP